MKDVEKKYDEAITTLLVQKYKEMRARWAKEFTPNSNQLEALQDEEERNSLLVSTLKDIIDYMEE